MSDLENPLERKNSLPDIHIDPTPQRFYPSSPLSSDSNSTNSSNSNSSDAFNNLKVDKLVYARLKSILKNRTDLSEKSGKSENEAFGHSLGNDTESVTKMKVRRANEIFDMTYGSNCNSSKKKSRKSLTIRRKIIRFNEFAKLRVFKEDEMIVGKNVKAIGSFSWLFFSLCFPSCSFKPPCGDIDDDNTASKSIFQILSNLFTFSYLINSPPLMIIVFALYSSICSILLVVIIISLFAERIKYTLLIIVSIDCFSICLLLTIFLSHFSLRLFDYSTKYIHLCYLKYKTRFNLPNYLSKIGSFSSISFSNASEASNDDEKSLGNQNGKRNFAVNLGELKKERTKRLKDFENKFKREKKKDENLRGFAFPEILSPEKKEIEIVITDNNVNIENNKNNDKKEEKEEEEEEEGEKEHKFEEDEKEIVLEKKTSIRVKPPNTACKSVTVETISTCTSLGDSVDSYQSSDDSKKGENVKRKRIVKRDKDMKRPSLLNSTFVSSSFDGMLSTCGSEFSPCTTSSVKKSKRKKKYEKLKKKELPQVFPYKTPTVKNSVLNLKKLLRSPPENCIGKRTSEIIKEESIFNSRRRMSQIKDEDTRVIERRMSEGNLKKERRMSEMERDEIEKEVKESFTNETPKKIDGKLIPRGANESPNKFEENETPKKFEEIETPKKFNENNHSIPSKHCKKGSDRAVAFPSLRRRLSDTVYLNSPRQLSCNIQPTKVCGREKRSSSFSNFEEQIENLKKYGRRLSSISENIFHKYENEGQEEERVTVTPGRVKIMKNYDFDKDLLNLIKVNDMIRKELEKYRNLKYGNHASMMNYNQKEKEFEDDDDDEEEEEEDGIVVSPLKYEQPTIFELDNNKYSVIRIRKSVRDRLKQFRDKAKALGVVEVDDIGTITGRRRSSISIKKSSNSKNHDNFVIVKLKNSQGNERRKKNLEYIKCIINKVLLGCWIVCHFWVFVACFFSFDPEDIVLLVANIIYIVFVLFVSAFQILILLKSYSFAKDSSNNERRNLGAGI